MKSNRKTRERRARETREERDQPSLRGTVAEVIGRLDVPLGYTLTIWAAGILALGHYGFPSVGEVYLFVGGAGIGYVVLAYTLALQESGRATWTIDARLAGIDVLAVLIAVPTSFIANLVSSPAIGHFVTALSATFVYALVLGVLDYLAWRFWMNPPRR